MVVTIGALGRIRSDGDTSKLLIASAIAFIPLTDIVQNNLVNGQVNFIVIACCAAFAWSRHRGRHTIGSFWLGAAIAIKLTPAILLGFLARRLEWRRVVETVVIAAILGVVLPWLITGADVFDYYRDYFGTFVTDTISDARVESAERFPFSVAGVVRKFVGVSSPISATIIGLAMAAVLVLWLDRGGAARSGRSLALTVCLYLAGALLITPMSEIHHLASLLPGLTLLAYQALEPRKPLWLRWGLAVALLSAIVIRRVPGAAFVSVAATCALLAAALRREALD
jgi:alpha-1,2-mannosyltransferase